MKDAIARKVHESREVSAPFFDEHCFVVRTWSIDRVQEAHTLLLHLVWDLVHVAMGEDDVL